MSDMSQVIIPKSDQLNADDLIAGPKTITITQVTIRGGQEQPIAISFEGDNGKPYKACKSMCRVMVTAWGADSKKYIGRSMTLYRDPTVKWGGMEVGGIRISHMSDIAKPITLALTMTKANRKPFTVQPLSRPATQAPESPPVSDDGGASFITPEQATTLRELCKSAAVSEEKFLQQADAESFDRIQADDYEAGRSFLQKRADKIKSATAPTI